MTNFFQNNTVLHEKSGGTWLELFFDLVYVAILVELGQRLSHNFTLAGVVAFAAMFVLIWWSWLSLVFYTRYFPSDDIGQRLLTAVYMFIMIVLAFEIHNVTVQTLTYFVLAYAATKFVLAAMYGRSWFDFPDSRALTSHYMILYLAIGFLWLSIAMLNPENYWWWGVATVIDIFIPLLIQGSHKIQQKPQPIRPPLKHHYMRHRFGELTIIVLGEFFIKLIASSSEIEQTPFNFYLGVCLLAISLSIWWLYFDHTDHAHLGKDSTHIFIWTYSHYFLLAAITAYGVVGTKIFASIPESVLSSEKRLLFCIALAIVLLALGMIDWASPEENGRLSRRPHLTIRIGAALVLLLLAGLGNLINVGWFVTLVGLVLIGQVAFDIGARLQNKVGVETAVTH
jgi:low temperature requirement protein LtrA